MTDDYNQINLSDEGTLLDLHNTKTENTSESLSGSKICKQCGKDFVVGQEDLEFYDKISPTFAGKKYQIPSPTLCPDCRNIKRLAWRNQTNLFKRKCDKTGKEIISIYSPDKTEYKVYDREEWWKDDWDAKKYGRDYDFSKSFFVQFDELEKDVPKIALTNVEPDNSEYCNYAYKNTNSYMLFGSGWNENCMYSQKVYDSNNVVDSIFCVKKCSYIYQCISCSNSSNSRYCIDCSDINNCLYCYDLKNCHDCLFSHNLRNKQYCIKNKQLTKDEYEEEIKKYNFGSYSKNKEYIEDYKKIIKNSIHPYAINTNCEDCSGDYLVGCKDTYYSFGSKDCEDSKFMLDSASGKDCYDDCFSGGEGTQLNIETIGSLSPYGGKFLFSCWTTRNLIYCDFCHNSDDCFGCVGLRHAKYCILNKQYTKEEYEVLVPKIIEYMTEKGEWGEFFTLAGSAFGYNETQANDYFPKNKEEALKIGANWQDNDFSLEHKGAFYEPEDDIKIYVENDDKRNDLLKGIMRCEITDKPFKIMSQELAFYIEQGIPIPRKYYKVRDTERFSMRNQNILHHRQCMCEDASHGHEGRCKNEFETTYAPARPEKVYCEECYQKNVL